MAMASRVTGDKKGNGDGNEEGCGNQWRQHGQWLWQRGWWVSNGGNNGDGDGDGAKDTATTATIGGPVQDLSNFQMAQIPFFSGLICSTHSPHDILKV
jgi:hypothetical protein